LKNKFKLNEICLENNNEIKNNSYFPHTYRGEKEKKSKIKNLKMNSNQKYNKSSLNIEISNKIKSSIISNLNDELNNEVIDKSTKIKKKIHNFELEPTNNLAFDKKLNSNKINFKSIEIEPCLTYRKIDNTKKKNLLLSNKNNPNSQNNILSVQNNDSDEAKKHILPIIYKKCTAISPFIRKKKLPSLFSKDEEYINYEKDKEKEKINLKSNKLNPKLKMKSHFNLNKMNHIKTKNNYSIHKTKKDLKYIPILDSHEINQSKSCFQMNIAPKALTNVLSEKAHQIQKGYKNDKKLLNNNGKNTLKQYKIKKEKINIIEIKRNSSICKGGENPLYKGKKINQDNLFKTKFDDLDISFFGVCDGHGDNGHLISEFIKINLPLIMYKKIKSLFYLINNNNQTEEKVKAYFSEICKQSFDITNKKLISNKNIDSSLSGSTCISLLLYQNLIISANLGDSRAIMGKFIENKWAFELLSRDHKPSEIDEALRIKYKKGEIHPFFEENGNFSGPNRVWVKGQGIPGLAMSRSFGDIIGSTVGVLNEPEIKFFNYDENDKFIIIASDGLWEYISCQEAINIVGEIYQVNNLDSDSAVIKLYQIARNRWIENQNCIDDISIIILFL